ncbi:adenylate/guanylate cyclase domain-containing protein [Chloroflexota bacterium]
MGRTTSESYPALLLFTDIIDSSVHSSYLGTKDFADRVLRFQGLFQALGDIYFPERRESDRVTEWARIRSQGDEGLVFILDAKRNRKELVFRAVRFAFELKVRWYLAVQQMIKSPPNPAPKGMEIAIGMHYGEVTSIVELEGKAQNRQLITDIIGYSINYAKRVESSSRVGRFSKVFLSEDTARLLADAEVFLFQHNVPLKGIGDAEPVYEARGLIHATPIIGEYAGGVTKEQVAELLSGRAGHRDLLSVPWLRSYAVAVSMCAEGTEVKAFDGLLGTIGSENEEDPICLFCQAQECNRVGKYTRAISYLKKVLKDNPNFKRGRLMLIDDCWKALESKGSLTADHIFVRDAADEMLSNEGSTLSPEEKESLERVIQKVAAANTPKS